MNPARAKGDGPANQTNRPLASAAKPTGERDGAFISQANRRRVRTA